MNGEDERERRGRVSSSNLFDAGELMVRLREQADKLDLINNRESNAEIRKRN